MILPAQHIRRRCVQMSMISPFEERGVIDGMSYGLSAASYDVRNATKVYLPPTGHVVLSATLERFSMPYDVCARVCDKSTWARRGVFVQNTFIDPGWCGYLTLELTNNSGIPITIKEGWPIAQLIFEQLLESTEHPYTGKYQNQSWGPQEAREER